VVEVQQTFYQIPRIATGKRWREEAPPDFEFTMKAWQLITHEPSSPTYRRLRTVIPGFQAYLLFNNLSMCDDAHRLKKLVEE